MTPFPLHFGQATEGCTLPKPRHLGQRMTFNFMLNLNYNTDRSLGLFVQVL